MAAITVYDHIQRNNLKVFFLVLMFPVSLGVILFGLIHLMFMGDPEGLEYGLDFFYSGYPIVLGVCLLWMLIAYQFGDKMMLGFAGAKLLKDNPVNTRVFRSVENVALAAGLPIPQVYIIEDESLNAFATGRTPKTASVALTRGIINALEPLELEAVIAHEMGHIGNRDIRLHMMIITGLGAFALLGEFLFRTRVRNGGKDGKALIFAIILALMIFNWIVAPIIRLAISRANEYKADATAALITRNPLMLASALKKISKDARVEALDKSPQMGMACIFDPLLDENKSFSLSGLSSTHPPVELRIKQLQKMASSGLR